MKLILVSDHTLRHFFIIPAVPNTTTYLSDFSDDLAAISLIANTTLYSMTMEAIKAFAPAVRSSDLIRFLRNLDETMAEVSSDLLQQRTSGITFIYDDDNSESVTCQFNTNSRPICR